MPDVHKQHAKCEPANGGTPLDSGNWNTGGASFTNTIEKGDTTALTNCEDMVGIHRDLQYVASFFSFWSDKGSSLCMEHSTMTVCIKICIYELIKYALNWPKSA